MSADKPFRNRLHAGKQLALALHEHVRGVDPIVLALPRGGVPVGFAVARALSLPFDLLLVRKLGLPGHEELAMGAIGSGGVRVLNAQVVQAFHVAPATIDAVCARELALITRRELQYRGGRAQPALRARTAILLAQVFSNLLGNAIQHGDRSEPIGMRVDSGGNDIVVRIHNHGKAIAPHALATIFDPLVRFADPRNTPGGADSSLGIGLFIARAIVDAHGGDIRVVSDERSGTTFTVRLPRVPPRAPILAV